MFSLKNTLFFLCNQKLFSHIPREIPIIALRYTATATLKHFPLRKIKPVYSTFQESFLSIYIYPIKLIPHVIIDKNTNRNFLYKKTKMSRLHLNFPPPSLLFRRFVVWTLYNWFECVQACDQCNGDQIFIKWPMLAVAPSSYSADIVVNSSPSLPYLRHSDFSRSKSFWYLVNCYFFE